MMYIKIYICYICNICYIYLILVFNLCINFLSSVMNHGHGNDLGVFGKSLPKKTKSGWG